MKIVPSIAGLLGLIIVSLPLCLMFIITPAFTQLAEDNANHESVLIASHLAASLAGESVNLSRGELPEGFPAEVANVSRDFRLLLLRVLDPSGKIIYSTRKTEIGVIIRHDFFQNEVTKGRVYSLIVRRGKRSLEGETVTSDIAETYIPLTQNGTINGIFEIHYDVSARIAKLDQVMHRSNLLLLALVALLATITTAVLFLVRRKETERDQARTEWRNTFEAVTDPIMILSKEFTILRVNSAMSDLIGTNPEKAVGHACFGQIHHCSSPVDGCPHKKLLEDGKSHSSEVYDASSGRYFMVNVYPIFDEKSVLTGSVHYAKDITSRKKAEEELRQAERKYRIVADNAFAWEFWLAPDGSYLYTSPSCQRVTGYSTEEFTANPELFLRIVHPDDRQMVADHQYTLASPAAAAAEDLQFRIIRRDGELRWISHNCQPVYDPDGNYLGIRGSNNDITARKQALDALQETASSLAEAQRIAHLGSWEIDLATNSVKATDEVLRICELEQSGQQISLSVLRRRLHPDDRHLVDEAYVSSLNKQAPVDFVHRLKMPDGRIKYVQDRCETICDSSGKPLKLVGTVQDITPVKLAEEALRESEERFRGLAASAHDAIIMMDENGRVAFWNLSASEVFGYSREEVMGRELHPLIVPERHLVNYQRGFTRFQSCGEGEFVGKTLELSARKKDGTEFPMEFSVAAIQLRGKWQAISILRDISERKRSEMLIQQQLKNLTALSEIGMAISSTNDIRTTLNILLDRLISQLGMAAGSVFLLDQESLDLSCAASLGFSTPTSEPASVHIGCGHAGQIAFELKQMVIPDLDETFFHPHREKRFRAYLGMPLIARGKVVGVLEMFNCNTLQPTPEWLRFLELMTTQAAIAIDNVSLFQNLQRTNTELAISYDATLEGWGRTLEFRDEDTRGHTERVANIAVRFARLIGLDERDIVHLRRGALLHDIGKIGIPDAILLKAGEFTPEEQKIMQLHTTYAFELLKPIPFLRPALDIPYCHHEKWNGSGTPRGLKGEAIPLAARIFAVVDVWDALMSDRPYRQAWPAEKVKEYIRNGANTEFDPKVVEVFLQNIGEICG